MRTTGVKLVADVTQFKKEMTEAEKATLGLKDGLEDVATEGDKAGDELGKKFGESGKAAHRLRGEIDQTKATLANLAHEFANTDDAAQRLDISKSIRKQQGELRRLLSVEKLLPKPAEVEAVGSKIGKTLGTSIGDHLELLKSGPALAAIAAVAAPVIGATISAAVIGGAGVGGVLGGVILAARDPRVKSAGTQLGKNLLADLVQDSQSFIGPVLHQVDKIDGAFTALRPKIKGIFDTSSGFLDPLTDGVLKGVDGIVRGVSTLVSKAGPVIQALSGSFDIIGNAVGDAFETIAGGSDEAASALTNVSKAIGATIQGVGYLVRGLTELYGVVSYVPGKIIEARDALASWVGIEKQATDGSTALAAGSSTLAAVQRVLAMTVLTAGEAAGQAGMQMQTYADKQAAAAARGRGLYDAQTALAGALSGVQKAIKENGRSLDVHTEKGRANRTMLSELSGKLQDADTKYAALGISSTEASKRANTSRETFIKVAGQFTKTRGEAAALADQMGFIKSKKIDFLANTHDAAGRIAALRDQIAGVHGKTVTITTVLKTNRVGDEALHGLPHRAAGGSVKQSKAYIVGEKRAEVFVPDRDGTIVPSVSQYAAGNATREYAMSSGRGGGATYMSLVVQNHGVIGSKAEVDNWLSGAVDDLKRRGKI